MDYFNFYYMKGGNNKTDVNSKPQISSRLSVRSRNVVRGIRRLWDPRDTFPQGIRQRIYLTGTGLSFRHAFPECTLFDILLGVITVEDPLFGRDFYVRKVVWNDNSDGNTVTFIAGPNHQIADIDDPNINNEEELVEWQNNNPWFGRATCVAGVIIALNTNDFVQPAFDENNNEPQHDLSARLCGFASFLSYLCFLDRDHLNQLTGYQLRDDSKWRNPTMRQIQSIGFNNRQCKRIIHVSYEDWEPEEPGTMRGNKAFIYGAAAAGYYRLATYRKERCKLRRNCCEGGIRGRIGNVFKIHDLLDDINTIDPAQRPKHRRRRRRWLTNFQKHYGKDWYFCKTTRRRT
jgi:hypothetical protein